MKVTDVHVCGLKSLLPVVCVLWLSSGLRYVASPKKVSSSLVPSHTKRHSGKVPFDRRRTAYSI
jgi:hypothetical protein